MNSKVVVGRAQKRALVLDILSIGVRAIFWAGAAILLLTEQFVLAAGILAFDVLIFRFVWRKIKAG